MHDGPQDSGAVPAADSFAARAEHDPAARTEHDAAWPAEREARERLHTLDDAPLDEHVQVYEDVHRQLQEGLADLDEG